MKILRKLHPVEDISEEFLLPFQNSANRLYKDISILQTRISIIIKWNRSITANAAFRLSK
jgi:plasmid maintenance system antidote protein VapI